MMLVQGKKDLNEQLEQIKFAIEKLNSEKTKYFELIQQNKETALQKLNQNN